jgi:hypothetical protein
MEASTRALAKANDISAEAMERAAEAIRQVGFRGEDALHAIDRLIIADLDLSKAQGLAKLSASRRRWRQGRRLSPSAMDTLRAFYEARKGPKEPFYVYDPYEPAPGQAIGSNYDWTGASTQGRYAVRFEGEFRQNLVLGRPTADLELFQVA